MNLKYSLALMCVAVLLSSCSLRNAEIKPESLAQSGIRIIDQQSLFYPRKYTIPFSEISDLAYDKRLEKLYMIGDKGYFYTFSAQFTPQNMVLKYLQGYKITEAKKLSAAYDIEGLAQNNKGDLFASFERTPRISRLSKTGYLSDNQVLPSELSKKNNYHSANKIFEALAWHPRYGLLTAGEYPLHKKPNTQQTIYSLKGDRWGYRTQPYKNIAITALEVMDDNHLLILERAYTEPFAPLHITLRKLYLKQCKGQQCKTEILASFSGQIGATVHNYEGLAKVGRDHYIMVSDNNNKSYLPTNIIYFKVVSR